MVLSAPELTAALYASLVEHLERTGVIHTRPFDASAPIGAKLADISTSKLRWFLERAREEREFPLAANTPVGKALAHLDLLDHGRPTHAALLLFGVNPQRFLPTSEVKCLHFHGTEVAKPIPSYQIYKGTVFGMVDQAVDFVLSKVSRSVGTRARSNDAPVEYELPKEVVAEAIVNAVAHRDYASNASVQVMLFRDRLEIWNPGELPPSLTMALLRKAHPSVPRNPLVAEPFFRARYIEKVGTGTLDMIARLRAAGLQEPEFVQDGGTFVQRVWRPRQERGAGTRPESRPEWWRARPVWRAEWIPSSIHDRIMAALQVRSHSRAEIASALGHGSISGALKHALDELRAARLVLYTKPQKPNSRLQRYQSASSKQDSGNGSLMAQLARGTGKTAVAGTKKVNKRATEPTKSPPKKQSRKGDNNGTNGT